MTSHEGPELLDDGFISNELSPVARALLLELRIHDSIDSTNAELQRRTPPRDGAHVCLAEQQSAGRGRRGREWVSPAASNIYCSVAWTLDGGVDALAGLSLTVGVVLCDALESLGVSALGLKWPNDVLADGKKLAGILVETQGDPAGPITAIIGVGINVRMSHADAAAIDQPWTDLQTLSGEISRNRVVGSFLNNLLPALSGFQETGFSTWQDRWQARHIYADELVTVHSVDHRIAGTARGVDARGALLLETATGMQTIHGGEVSMRPQS